MAKSFIDRFQGMELDRIISFAFMKYNISQSQFKNYAARRGKKTVALEYLAKHKTFKGGCDKMIHQDTLGKDRINSLRGQLRGADPGILEKLIRAYYLTEQLVVVGLDFVFKGGTCLTGRSCAPSITSKAVSLSITSVQELYP
jgi:hypothetical protein